MGIRSDLALMQEFTGADTDLCAVALDLQDLGAKFEIQFKDGGWLSQRGDFAFNAKTVRYRMVFPPDRSTIEPTSEPTASPLFEDGKRYANGVGDVFEVTGTSGVEVHLGYPHPIEACCVVAASGDVNRGQRLFFTREGVFIGNGSFPEWNLLPGEVQAEAHAASPSSDVPATTDVPVAQSAQSELDRRAAESSKDELIQLLFEHQRQLLSAGFRLAGEALLSSGENPDLHRTLILAVVEWSRVAGEGFGRSGSGS